MELFGSEILNVELVDSPEVPVHVCYSMWYHITEDCNLNVLMVPVHYSLAFVNILSVYEL
jgi:hypothetical protein